MIIIFKKLQISCPGLGSSDRFHESTRLKKKAYIKVTNNI